MANNCRNLLAALAVCAMAGSAGAEPAPAPVPMGVMGTIPLYWGEAEEMGDLLSGAEPHWARAVIERDHELRPLDTLAAETLAGLDLLLLAQPRALAAAENVALDRWVRDGGRLLLFADPMLTGESHFPLGDRRRPQEVILLSPILTHWGLRLQFMEDQPAAPRMVAADGVELPVRLAGSFVREDAGTGCALDAEAVLARCAIGAGRAVILADAALLDLHDPHPAAPDALAWLLRQMAGEDGDGAGKSASCKKPAIIQMVEVSWQERKPPGSAPG